MDFYAELCDVLCEYAHQYDGTPPWKKDSDNPLSSFFHGRSDDDEENEKKRVLKQSLIDLFGSEHPAPSCSGDDKENESIVAHAIPTIQFPPSFFGDPRFRSLPFSTDAEATRNLLTAALAMDPPASVRLSSAYWNPTEKLLSVLRKFGMGVEEMRPTATVASTLEVELETKAEGRAGGDETSGGAAYIVTAGLTSHGFAPKVKTNKRRQSMTTAVTTEKERYESGHGDSLLGFVKNLIPRAYQAMAKDTALVLGSRGGEVLMYNRPGWTFHAKQMLIHRNDDYRAEIIHNPSTLLAAVVGSGNYGARSENLDAESNCILVFEDDTNDEREPCATKESIAAEWNDMCSHCSKLAGGETQVKEGNHGGVIKQYLFQVLRRYF